MTAPVDTLDYRTPARRLSGFALVMEQTWALLVDAYRQLQAGMLFWITLALSTLVAASFALVGVNEEGLKILWFDEIAGEFFNTSIISPAAFYKLVFLTFGVQLWLAWAAVILALISTAGIIPELIKDGAIDLYLSKPMSRFRLFITKYVSGLLFVAVQTFCFSVAAFLVIGIRGGVWELGLFWAVPLVTLFYSFLYCIAAGVGLVTGSTLAAILVTVLIWFFLFILNVLDMNLLQAQIGAEIRQDNAARNVALNEALLERFESWPEEEREGSTAYQTAMNGLSESSRIETEAEASVESWRQWHRAILATKAPLPKTGETIGLLERLMIESAELDEWSDRLTGASAENIPDQDSRDRHLREMDATMVAEERYIGRSAWWSLGTSLGFEVVVLGLCAWIFARRDF